MKVWLHIDANLRTVICFVLYDPKFNSSKNQIYFLVFLFVLAKHLEMESTSVNSLQLG